MVLGILKWVKGKAHKYSKGLKIGPKTNIDDIAFAWNLISPDSCNDKSYKL